MSSSSWCSSIKFSSPRLLIWWWVRSLVSSALPVSMTSKTIYSISIIISFTVSTPPTLTPIIKTSSPRSTVKIVYSPWWIMIPTYMWYWCVYPPTHIPFSYIPVSYTHLDVYKRQVLCYAPLMRVYHLALLSLLGQSGSRCSIVWWFP